MHSAVENPAVITDLFSRKTWKNNWPKVWGPSQWGTSESSKDMPPGKFHVHSPLFHAHATSGGRRGKKIHQKKVQGHSDNESLINHPLLVSIIHLIIWVDTVWIIGFSAKLNQASALQLPFALHLKPSSSCHNWVSGNDAAPKPLGGSVLNRGTRPFSGLGAFTYNCTMRIRSRLPQYSCPQERPGHFVVIVKTTTWATKISKKNPHLKSCISW